MTPLVLTGRPERSVGVKVERRAASAAACCKSAWPETAEAEMTLPLSSTTTCTVTAPEARAARAADGYCGAAMLTALPFRTPPEMAFSARGAGPGFGGGGTSDALATGAFVAG